MNFTIFNYAFDPLVLVIGILIGVLIIIISALIKGRFHSDEKSDKEQVKADIRYIANKLREADLSIRKLYFELNNIYKKIE